MENDQRQYDNIYLIETLDGLKIVGKGATTLVHDISENTHIKLWNTARFSHDSSGDVILMVDPLVSDTINLKSDHIFCASPASSYLSNLYTIVLMRTMMRKALVDDTDVPMLSTMIH